MQRSSDLASDVTRLQTRFAAIDEELHNVMLENSAPASVYPVTTAVPPLTRTKSGVVRNSFLIMFAGLFFGLLAAISAHKLDPKVYVAADVELVLGFAPMAQLPDFNEVSEGVADEFLLRLASSIEHARKQSNLRSCVFTGINEGNGVTTLVNRLRAMLEAMGRTTVLVNASGAPPLPDRARTKVEHRPGLVPVERISRPTALLQQMEEETETEDEALVLTDTAPLAVSAETEYLARFVDCAIVVIESGRTTRRELRDAAATLQRLDVGAVGFCAKPRWAVEGRARIPHFDCRDRKASQGAKCGPACGSHECACSCTCFCACFGQRARAGGAVLRRRGACAL